MADQVPLRHKPPAETAPLVRPPPMLDETPMSHRYRVLRANGVRVHDGLMSALRLESRPLFYGNVLPLWGWKRLGGLVSTPVCCSCIQEKKYIKASWNLNGVDSCVIHGELLHAHVHERKKRLAYKDWQLLKSFDGQESLVVAGKRSPYQQEQKDVIDAVWPWLIAASPPSVEQIAVSTFTTELLRQLVFARRGRDIDDRRQPFWKLASDWLSRYRCDINPSVSGIEALLNSLPTPLHRVTVMRFLLAAVAEERTQESVLRALPLGQWLDGLTTQVGQIRIKGKGALGGAAGAAPKATLLTVTEAARRAGLTSRLRAPFLMAAQGLVPISTDTQRRSFRWLSPEGAEQLRLAAEELLSPQQASAKLKLAGRRALAQLLRNAGVLSCKRIGGKKIYLNSEVQGLLVRLDGAAQPYGAEASVPLNDPSTYSGLGPLGVREMFAAIFAGEVKVWRDHAAVGLAGIRISLESIEQIRESCRRHRGRREASPSGGGLCHVG